MGVQRPKHKEGWDHSEGAGYERNYGSSFSNSSLYKNFTVSQFIL